MTQTDIQWSSVEKQYAEAAIKKAYIREVDALINHVREQAGKIAKIEELWMLHDFLSARRHEIDGKYDERDDFLIFTLSNLLKAGLLDQDDLQGLGAGKKAKITLLARM